MKSIITLKNIKTFAYHGCMPEEALTGSHYSTDVTIHTDFQKALSSDELLDTVNYVEINNIVIQEMAICSKLLEHVAGRILDRIEREVKGISFISLSITKINPPLNNDLEAVTIQIIKEY